MCRTYESVGVDAQSDARFVSTTHSFGMWIVPWNDECRWGRSPTAEELLATILAALEKCGRATQQVREIQERMRD